MSRQRTNRRFEVIVVDSSSDRTAEIVREFPEVKLVKLEERTYSGAARNIGIAESKAPIVLFLDSDVIAERDWLEKMMTWHEREPKCAAVAGAILNGNPESTVSWASYITEFSEYVPVGKPHYRRVGVTANLSYKRWALETYGGFDNHLKQYVDTEFNCRLNAGGEKLLFVPTILVKHKHRTTLRAYLKHEIGRGRSALALRRRGYLPYSHVARARSLSLLVAGPAFLRLVYSSVARFARAGILPLRGMLPVLPVCILGWLAWTLGFVAESIRPTIRLSALKEERTQTQSIHT